jgi:hypothetical protein
MAESEPKDFVIENRHVLEGLARNLERISKDTDLDAGYSDVASAGVLLINNLLQHAEG